MKENSRIRFNPVTKEVEVEGSESFVKTYFDKLQAMISGSPKEAVAVKEKPIKVKAVKKVKAAKKNPVKKARKAAKKVTGEKKVTNIDAVVALIQASAEGISTATIKEKTGLAESQIWNIVNRAAKEGKIKKLERGSYGAADTNPEKRRNRKLLREK
jgi:hypothetical protein